jgi:polar amino acid transport system substrate-binding protein
MFGAVQCKLATKRVPPLLVAAILIFGAVGCTSPPADPEGTLDRIRGGTLRAGAVANDPWVTVDNGDLGGVEVRLLEEFAAQLEADTEWTVASEQELFGALEQGQLDVVVGGLVSDNPFSMHAAFTHPYVTSQVVVGTPPDLKSEDMAGIEVSVEAGTQAAGVLEKTDAVPVFVEDIAESKGAAAVEKWLLDDLELEDTGVRLVESDHVMAVRLGENGWMVALEMFLLERPGEIQRLIDEEGAL